MIQIKDSGIEWIGEIPQDWDKRKLKYIAKVETGGTPPRGDDSNFDDEYGIQWIKPDNILENNTISATKEKVSIEAAKNLPIISKGSTVVCCIGTVGKCAYVSEKSVSNQQINAVTFCDEYDSRYGFYSTLISKQEYEAQANKVVVSILNKFQQSNIFYPYCKINKQQNIADYLDKKCSEIDACLSDVNESIAKLQEYKKSIITEAVTKGLDTNAEMKDSGIEWIGESHKGWVKKPIKRLLESRKSGAWGKEPNIDEGTDKICIRVADFDFEKQIVNRDNLTIRNYDENTIKKLELKKGDILIEKSGGGEVTPVGRSVIFSLDSSCLYANFIDCLRCDKENEPKYIVLLLKALYHYGLIPSFIKQTTGIQNLDFPNLSQSNIFVPKKTVQQQIADYLDKKCAEIDNVIEDKKELAKKLKEYKNSLIYECVTGKREVG